MDPHNEFIARIRAAENFCTEPKNSQNQLDAHQENKHPRQLQIDSKCAQTWRTYAIEIEDQVYKVGDPFITIDVPIYIDFVSARFGGGDFMYCGARTIGTVTPQATYQNTL